MHYRLQSLLAKSKDNEQTLVSKTNICIRTVFTWYCHPVADFRSTLINKENTAFCFRQPIQIENSHMQSAQGQVSLHIDTVCSEANLVVNIMYALKTLLANSVDPDQPVRSAQADHGLRWSHTS